MAGLQGLDRMHLLELDVTSAESIARAKAAVTELTGGALYALVNNACVF